MKKIIVATLIAGSIIGGSLNHTSAKGVNWVSKLHDTKVLSGKIIKINKSLTKFDVKVGKKIYHCNDNQVDGFIFGKGQKLYLEFNKKGIKQVDSYDPIKWLKHCIRSGKN